MAIGGVLSQLKTNELDANALDVGAGECPLREEVENAGYLYQSLDIEQNAQGTIDHITRIDTDFPISLNGPISYDLVICTEVLEHVAFWESAFKNLNALTKIEGHCIISVPFVYMPHEEPHDYWRPTDHAIILYGEKFGFQVIHAERLGEGWPVLGTLMQSTSVCRESKTLLGFVGLLPIYLIHGAMKRALRWKGLKRFARLQTRFYLSNFFVLRKVSSLELVHK